MLPIFGDGADALQKGAERCVGVGRCLRDDAGTMCPSYRATRDERHSTRGRAKLLVELFQGETTPATWRNEDVREALDLCLSCKGAPFDLGQWRSQGVDPESLFAIGIKAAVAHRRAYDPIARASYVLNTPGPCASDLRTLPYRRVRRPIHPLDAADA